MDLDQLFEHADSYQLAEHQLPVRLVPFIPDYVPALGAPHAFTAPPRPDGEPDFLGLTVLDEPALHQSDPATVALRLRAQQAGGGGSGTAGGTQPPLGWVADPARQPQQLDAWIEQVEALHQAYASAAALAPAPPDLEALMQAWTPEMQAHIAASPLPDPRQDCDLPTYARMACSVLDLQPPGGGGGSGGHAGLLQSLHALFALYLEFKYNSAFHSCGAFSGSAPAAEEAAAEGTAWQPAGSGQVLL